jgi:hypothetical protein
VHLPFFNKGSKGRAVVFAVVSFIINLTVYCYSKGLCLGFILVVLGALVLVALGVVAIRLISVSLTICKGLRLGSYRTGILELYSIEKRTTGS